MPAPQPIPRIRNCSQAANALEWESQARATSACHERAMQEREGSVVLANRQLQKLRRGDLLQLLLEVERENERLAQENQELKDQLASKELAIREAGTLADAAVRLNGVMQAVQAAAEMYLHNVRELCLSYARETEALCSRSDPHPSLQEEVRRLFAAEDNGSFPHPQNDAI